jgi:uncharacterized protein (DUF1778 family)
MAQLQYAKSALRTQRLEARVTPSQKELIARAAQLRGTTVTEFVVASVQEAATSTVKDFEILQLRDAAKKFFIKTILNPPSVTPKAKAAALRYKKHTEL